MSGNPVSNYVIFAAGVGSRMNVDLPKWLVDIDGRGLFEYQLSQLSSFAGCIYIVCGYRAEAVCQQVSQFIDRQAGFIPQVCFIYNPDYRQSQVTSIARTLNSIPLNRRSFLIDGDLLFRSDIIESLHGRAETAVVVRSDVSRDAVIANASADRLISFDRGGDGNLEWANVAMYEPSELEQLSQICRDTTATHHFDLINELVRIGNRVRIQQSVVAEIDEPEDLPALKEFAKGLV